MFNRVTKIGLLTILSVMASTAFAVTNVSGVITEDTVWAAADGPYRVAGSIQVAPGATLTIEGGALVDGAEVTFLSNLLKSHATHFDNTGKGPGITDCNVCHQAMFADYQPLETTTVCDACHSPGGGFPNSPDGLMDPVVGAKANFKLGGVYEDDLLTLKEGKGEWCSTCHDAQQSISNPVGSPYTYAPNVVGDNTTYGYWATGHGKSINDCLECHDANKKHFDHEHRTYEIDEATGDVVNPWGDSYRLRTSSTVANEQICVSCHDQSAIQNVGEQSNYKATGTQFDSAHSVHIWSNTLGTLADTDYDGVEDSRPACATCHNVHGSKSNHMTRTGELASTPGTTDRTPGLDHIYVKPNPGPVSTATWRPNLPAGGNFGVYTQWRVNGNQSASANFTVYYDGGSTTVAISMRAPVLVNGWASLGSYNFVAGTTGYVELAAGSSTGVLVADKLGIDTNGDGIPDIIVDDSDPEFSSIDMVNGGEWPYDVWADGRAINYFEKYVEANDLADSTGSYVRFGQQLPGYGKSVAGNNTCVASCHGAIPYERTPFLGPKVINRFEGLRWASNDGTGVADVIVSVTDPDGDMAGGSVTIDVSSFGGSGAEAMTDNGDGTYSYQLPIPLGTADQSYALPITAIDAAGNVGANVSSSVFVTSATNNIYLDNVDVIHSDAGNWLRDILSGAAYRGSYITTWNHRNNPDESALTATWKPQIENAGDYNVYAWLQQSTIWNENAVYTVQHSGGETPVAINQRTGASGGDWMLIGTFTFDAGDTASITLSGSGFGLHHQLYVDAVKLEPVPTP